MIEPEALKIATAKLLLDSLTAEDREKLLLGAMQHLLEPLRGTYHGSSGKSPLQEKFNEVMSQEATVQVRAYLQLPEQQARIREFMVKAMEKAFSEGFVDQLAQKFLHKLWD